MIKRVICIFLCMIILVFSIISLASCASSEAPELDGIKERLVYLIEESKSLNVLFFGKGLPVYRSDSELADRKMVYLNVSYETQGYDRSMENSSYSSIDEIKAAAKAVFSKDYSEEIFESAIDGIMIGETSAYVRFYDNGEWLLQNKNINDFKVEERIYDYSTMKIIEPSDASYINVSVETYSIADNQRRVVYLSFSFENGNWYLDSPTY